NEALDNRRANSLRATGDDGDFATEIDLVHELPPANALPLGYLRSASERCSMIGASCEAFPAAQRQASRKQNNRSSWQIGSCCSRTGDRRKDPRSWCREDTARSYSAPRRSDRNRSDRCGL